MKNPGSLTNKADIAVLPCAHVRCRHWETTIVLPHIAQLTEMDKHRLGVRTDAVRHGAFHVQYRAVVRAAVQRRTITTRFYLHSFQQCPCLVSVWSDISAAVIDAEHGTDCVCAHIRFISNMLGVCSHVLSTEGCSRSSVLLIICPVQSFSCWLMLDRCRLFPSSNTDIILIRILTPGSSISISISSSQRSSLRSVC